MKQENIAQFLLTETVNKIALCGFYQQIIIKNCLNRILSLDIVITHTWLLKVRAVGVRKM